MTRTRVNGQDRAWRNWNFFTPVQNGVQILKFRQGINLLGGHISGLKLSQRKGNVERRRQKLEWKHIDHMTVALKVKKAPKRWRCVRRYSWIEWKTAYGHILGHVTLANFFSAAFCHFCHHETVQMVPEKCLKVSHLLVEKVETVVESYDAAKLLHSLRNLHIELCNTLSLSSCSCWTGKKAFVTWNQVPSLCKRRRKPTTGYMDGLSNQEKKLR